MPNLEALPQKYFPQFTLLVEILNDKGKKYEAQMVQGKSKTWVYIQMPNTYEAIPLDNFTFKRGKLYLEKDFKEVIDALNYYINNQEDNWIG